MLLDHTRITVRVVPVAVSYGFAQGKMSGNATILDTM